MQEQTQNQKEVQASFETLKSQIVVAEAEMQSKEGVRRIIKKYQGRIAEMLKLMQRQKKQNDSLKAEFRLLNEQLSSVLKKVHQKPKEDDHKNADARNQITKKQLENEIKKNGIMKKEIQQLRYKYKYLEGDKIDGFKNEIKDQERTIDELNAKIRLFEKLDRQEKNADSYKKEEELTQKILKQNQEIVFLKKKVQQHRKKEEDLQKSIKTLRQQISSIEGKIPSKSTIEEKPKEKVVDKAAQQQLQKLKDKYKQLQNAKKMNDKSSRHEIDSLSNKLKGLQRQLIDAKDAVLRKDKESNIMLFKLKQKERKHFNTLQPIKTARYSEEVIHNSSGGLFQTRRQFRGLSWGQGIYRQFDDSAKLPAQKNYRIKRLVFTFVEQHVLSLTTDYDILEGDFGKDINKRETKTIESFAIPTQYANIQIVQHLFGDYEYITSMDLYCGKGIEYVRVTTSKQHLLEVGNAKSLPKCKRHSFQIGSHEKPIAVMGVIENRKHGGENREYLVNMGLELRRKEVFIRGRPKRLESSLNRSIMRGSNDKNKKE